jgi:hypothetical protein
VVVPGGVAKDDLNDMLSEGERGVLPLSGVER